MLADYEMEKKTAKMQQLWRYYSILTLVSVI